MFDEVSPTNENQEEGKVFELIYNRDWKELTELLKSNPTLASLAVSGTKRRTTENHLVLHEVCKHQPPLELVEIIINANPTALKLNGQCGFTPLHWAVSHGASAAVVSKLIESYPPCTRARDDLHQLLPLHLAAKWGVPQDVVLEILVAHPEGYYIRDADGLTPLDYANQLRLPSDRERMKTSLSDGPLLCKVSKAAQIRVAHEQEAKLRRIQEVHAEEVAHWEEKYLQEKLKAKAQTEALQRDLREKTDLANKTSRELDEKTVNLSTFTIRCSELEAKLDRERKLHSNAIDIQKAEMESVITVEKEKHLKLSEDFTAKEAEIQSLQEKLNTMEQKNESLNVDLKSQQEIIEMMVEEVEKLTEAESRLEKTAIRIQDLESELQFIENSEIMLKETIEEMNKTHRELEQSLKQSNIECNEIRYHNEELSKKLNASNVMITRYKSRLEQIRGWFKEVSDDMDNWDIVKEESSEKVEQEISVQSTNGNSNIDLFSEGFDNGTLGAKEGINDDYLIPSEELIDDLQSAYSGVELTLESMPARSPMNGKQVLSNSTYQTRISPVDDAVNAPPPSHSVPHSLELLIPNDGIEGYDLRNDLERISIEDRLDTGKNVADISESLGYDSLEKSFSLEETSMLSKEDDLVKKFTAKNAM